MKSNLTRILCLLLSLVMVFSLAACGEAEDSGSTLDFDDEAWEIEGVDEDTDADADVDTDADDDTDADADADADDDTDADADADTDADADADADDDTDADDDAETTSSKKTQNTSSKKNNTSSKKTQTTSSKKTQTTSSKKTQTTSSKKTQSTTNQNNKIENPDELSLKELTAKIPTNLRGSTVHVFSWNPVKDVTGAEKVVADFEKKTGIKVKWEQGSYDKYDETIVAKINSGAAPDIIRYNGPNPARMSFTQDVESATGFDFSGDIWDPAVLKAYTIKNKIYGVNMKDTFNKQPTVVMYLRSTIENHQLEDPYTLWKSGKWNFDKFKEMCLDFKEKTNGSCGWMSSRLIDIMWFRGIGFIEYDGKQYVNKATDVEVINAVKEVCNWRASDILSGGGSETDAFCAGNYLFYSDNILGARRNDSLHYVEQKKNNDLYCVPFPQESGHTYYQSFSESEAFGIPKGAKNPEAVYYFLRYYLDADNYDSKMFFSNNQILEVYNWCISQEKQHHTIDRYITQSYDVRNCGIENIIRGGLQAAQAQTELESLSPKFQMCVEKANDAIKKF